MSATSSNRYQTLIAHLFKKGYRKGRKAIAFDRTELEDAADLLQKKTAQKPRGRHLLFPLPKSTPS